MMKILMISDSTLIGGVETHILTLSEELVSRGHTVVAVTSNKHLETKFSEIGVKQYTLPICLTLEKENLKNIPKFLFSVFQLINIIKKDEIDIIHSHGPLSSSVYLSYLVSKILRKTLVYTIHGILPHKIFWNFFRYFGSKCNATIAISYEIKDYLSSNLKIDVKKIQVIYNGINLDKYVSAKVETNTLGNSTKKIVHITRLDREKIEATLKIINAVPEIMKSFSNIHLIIVGDGERFREVAEAAQEINAKFRKEIIKMVGYVEPERIPCYLQSSDIIIGAGRVVIEGMACGKPVIFLSSGGFGGALTEENWEKIRYYNFSGRGCKSDYDLNNISRIIIKLLDDPRYYYNAKHIGMKIADDMDIKKIGKQIEKLYTRII